MKDHIFASLNDAVSLCVRQDGFDRRKIVVAKWAETYHATVEQVRAAFARAMAEPTKLPEEIAASTTAISTEEDSE